MEPSINHFDIRPPILTGDPDTHLLTPYHDSITDLVCEGAVPYPANSVLLVSSKSPRVQKQAVAKFAKYFQREMNYGFPQYDASEYVRRYDYPRTIRTDRDLLAFLWIQTNTPENRSLNKWPTIGACCFRLKHNKTEEFWVLDWVWIHPYERRRSHLQSAWPFFRSFFGEFGLTPPVSDSMARFVRKLHPELERQIAT